MLEKYTRISGHILAALLVFCSLPGRADTEDIPELVFLNWSDYLEPSLVKAFESECDCKLRQVYYETDDHRDELMLASEGAGYDVLIINGLMVDVYRKRGWLSPIPEPLPSNLGYIDPRWGNAFKSATGYAVPYFWGTMGIGYRKDLVSEPITSWRQFFEPSEELRGRIRAINSARDLLAGALKALGESINSTDPEVLDRAEKLLLAQRPFVESYSYVSLTKDSALVKGDTVAAIMFSGDALMIREHDENIEYVLPREGGQIWIDHLAVTSSSSQKELAWSFISFLNRPENAVKNAEFVYYATPNTAAEKLLPREFLEDPIIYPDAETLRDSEYYQPLPPRVERKYGNIFTHIVR